MYAVVHKCEREMSEMLEPRNLRGTIDDLEDIIADNEIYRAIMDEKAVGKPGHYYGKDMVIEGAMPMAAFMLTPLEFGGDQDWWKDDRKFQDYMKRNPAYSWLNRR